MPSSTQPADPSAPISLERFATAIADMEVDQLYAETGRLELSLHHLKRSNDELREFGDDPDCVDAIRENELTIRRQEARVGVLREEVERRGLGSAHERAEDAGGVGAGERGNAEAEAEAEARAEAANGVAGNGRADDAGAGGGSMDVDVEEEEEEGVHL